MTQRTGSPSSARSSGCSAEFLVLPWTTLVYGFVQPNGLSILNWIFLGCAFMLDLATWGIGALASRKQVSAYRSA